MSPYHECSRRGLERTVTALQVPHNHNELRLKVHNRQSFRSTTRAEFSIQKKLSNCRKIPGLEDHNELKVLLSSHPNFRSNKLHLV
jgi:hypothetical protein